MAREILFKAKRADTKEWVEGYPVFDFADCSLKRSGKCACEHNGELLCFYGWIDELHEYDEIEVIPETICQYTGYKDNAGKRIFEGDIVAFEDMESTESGYSDMECCGKVGYDEEEACFYVTDRLSAESWEVLGECHIIGNIFDNPELLNQ